MELLGEAKGLHAARVQVSAFVENVTVSFSPGSVVDFGHQGVEALAGAVETIVEAHRIEAMTKVPQMGKEPDGPVGAAPRFLQDEISDRSIQVDLGLAQMVAAVEPGQIAATVGPRRQSDRRPLCQSRR